MGPNSSFKPTLMTLSVATVLATALASGAQLVSTDFPARVAGYDYVVHIPNGTPSRCNPVLPVVGCTSQRVE